MKRSKARVRTVQRTVLLVGEGQAEKYFLEHCKSLYLERNAGISIFIKNANGYGANGVVDYAIRQMQIPQYDACYALLDTDADWSLDVAHKAEQHGVTTLLAQPCLEALLLAIHSERTHGKSTKQLKKQFKQFFYCDASSKDLYPKQFPKALLDTASTQHPLLQQVLNVFKSVSD
jgi:hypothetical protein